MRATYTNDVPFQGIRFVPVARIPQLKTCAICKDLYHLQHQVLCKNLGAKQSKISPAP